MYSHFIVWVSLLLLVGCFSGEPGAPLEKKRLRFGARQNAELDESLAKDLAPVAVAPFELAAAEPRAEVTDLSSRSTPREKNQAHLLIQEVPVSPPVPGSAAAPITSSLAETAPVLGNTWQWPSSSPLFEVYAAENALKRGLKIKGRQGDPVLAASDGKVVYKGNGIRGYGEMVILKHEKGYLSAYAHNQTILVEEGDTVHSGQVIARMGALNAETYGLHFEIRHNGAPVDPLKYLPKR